MKQQKEQNENGKLAIESVVSKNKSVKSESVQRCIDFVLTEATHGREWSSVELAQVLNMEPGTLRFGIAIAEVNRAIERQGYHLSGRGKNGAAYFIEAVNRSSAIVTSMNEQALDVLKRAVVFAHGVITNHADKLDNAQRVRLEKQAEVTALRYVLARRIR